MPVEMAVPKVNNKMLEELEDMGFPKARAIRALHYSGNSSIEASVNWMIDHENDADIDQIPLIAVDIDVETPQPFHITELMKMKAQELRDRAHKMKEEEEEKKLERHRERERIRASKDLNEAKRTTEESERKRYLALRKAEKEEEKRARKKILQKLEQDKVERGFRVGLPSERPEALKPSMPILQGKKASLPVKSPTKVEHMRECLRSIKRSYLDDDARVRRAFQTLLIYVGNVAKHPDEEKFRKIRLGNPLFQGWEFERRCGIS
ncbi:UBX domain-containing protein 1-like isoform X2 [Juglans microcarpa x Juglans regia]|uniref:UBX domain-containing protein 1-like isoform X2 n=1 Tax=Juglans microcarpa x Juglans regia TaxID=2249226 RepID=UPI001B7F5091|nr:UBX domain-containing protein 1-like isoform X2 [Juglans microcarpa x Juglans regia]